MGHQEGQAVVEVWLEVVVAAFVGVAADIEAIADALDVQGMAVAVDACIEAAVGVYHFAGPAAEYYLHCMLVVVGIAEFVETVEVVGMTESMRTVYMNHLVELLDSQDYMMVPVRFAWAVAVAMEGHFHNEDYCFFEEHAIVCLVIVESAAHICYYHIQFVEAVEAAVAHHLAAGSSKGSRVLHGS